MSLSSEISYTETYGQNIEVQIPDLDSKIKEYIDAKLQMAADEAINEGLYGTNQADTTRNIKTSVMRRDSIMNAPAQNTGMERDVFSIMMLDALWSKGWCLGLISVTIQISLGILIILDQVEKDFFGTQLSIPIKGTLRLQVAQALAILLSIMTQIDLLMGLRTIFLLPFRKKNKWVRLIEVQNEERYFRAWFVHIFLPNILKVVEGGIILVASFVVIIQSESTVEVLKDYSALFVVSTVDNLFFSLAEMGYLGSHLAEKTKEVHAKKIDVNDEKISTHLKYVYVFLICIFLVAFSSITVGQRSGFYVKQAFPLCEVETKYEQENSTFLDLIGDGTCQFKRGKGTNIVECGWDGGDCEKFNQRYPECSIDDFSYLGDGTCDSESNNKNCGFDNGDCIAFNFGQQEKYPLCNVDNIAWIGDGICNGRDYWTKECEYDGGDCDNCTSVSDLSLIGNGKCDGGFYNTEGCSYDGGDCNDSNKEKKTKYTYCEVENIGWVGDGICNGREYASPECDNDGGDCDHCFVEDMMLVGNGFCNGRDYMSEGCSLDGGDCEFCNVDNPDRMGSGTCSGGEYNTIECGFDGGDCIKENEDLQLIYPDCVVQNPWWVGDEVCNGGEYYTEECGFDGGDCSSCKVDYMDWIGNNDCNARVYNTRECGFDGGDCDGVNAQKQDKYPDCFVHNIGWIDNGICDGKDYATLACGNDGGDCDECLVANISLVSDGFCDEGEYNTPACSYDGMDCVPSMKLIGNNHDGMRKWTSAVTWFDGTIYGIPYGANKLLKIDPNSSLSTLVGNDIGETLRKWRGGINLSNSTIFGIPFNAKSILQFDPFTEETKFIANNHSLLQSTEKFYSGAISSTGAIYFAPSAYNKVVKFNPLNIEDPLKELGVDLGDSRFKYLGATVANDGNVYLTPGHANRVLKITTANETISFIGDVFEGDGKWNYGVLAKDGNIYAPPLNANKVLQINVKDQSTTLVGPDLGQIALKWRDFVEGNDGFLYGIPFSSNKLLRFDPIHHTANLIPLDRNLHETRKWYGGGLSNNNHIYAIPFNSGQILDISPLKFQP